MIRWLKNWILEIVVMRLQVGAHCGLCGAWMEHELIYRDWPWSICSKCNTDYGAGGRFAPKE